MKRLVKNLLEYAKCVAVLLVVAGLFGCLKQSDTEDKVKIVEMTIYSETGYSGMFFTDIWTDVLIYSESDDSQKRSLTNTITEGFDFEYERGYEYSFKAKKIWMKNPPMDVSSIKYVFVGPLEKKKIIIENSEEIMELIVSSEMVKYFPQFPIASHELYDALLVKESNSDKRYVVKEIEEFNFESGYEYVISVKKITQGEPYLFWFVLLDIKDKQKK